MKMILKAEFYISSNKDSRNESCFSVTMVTRMKTYQSKFKYEWIILRKRENLLKPAMISYFTVTSVHTRISKTGVDFMFTSITMVTRGAVTCEIFKISDTTNAVVETGALVTSVTLGSNPLTFWICSDTSKEMYYTSIFLLVPYST